MLAYILRRLGQIVLVLLIFVTLTFFLLQAQPGDITSVYILNPNVPPEAREQIRRSLGLDRPLWEQYFVYLRNFLTGNLGVSFSYYPRSVISILAERIPRTVVLFLTATLTSFYLGFLMGKVIAWRRGSPMEYVATLGGVFLFTVFTPWFALMMIWLFAFYLDWLPVGKFLDPSLWQDAPVDANAVFVRLIATAALLAGTLGAAGVALRRLTGGRGRAAGLGRLLLLLGALGVSAWAWRASGLGLYAWDILRHLILPVLTLTLISFGGTMLLVRNSMLETLREDFVLAARAKGLPERVVRDRHAARNALLPVVTAFVFSLAFAIDGGVITETLFSWPGMGLTLLTASLEEDIPLAIGALVFTGVFALVAHLVADILYAFLDPRIRYR